MQTYVSRPRAISELEVAHLVRALSHHSDKRDGSQVDCADQAACHEASEEDHEFRVQMKELEHR